MLELALSLLRLGAAESMRAAGRRIGVALFFAVVASAAGTGALGCIITASWLALLPAIGPIRTPLVIGAILACVAAIFISALRKWPQRHSQLGGNLSGKHPSAVLSAVLCDHKTALLLGAALAGIVAGSNLGRLER